jgi:hypothetical protein
LAPKILNFSLGSLKIRCIFRNSVTNTKYSDYRHSARARFHENILSQLHPRSNNAQKLQQNTWVSTPFMLNIVTRF